MTFNEKQIKRLQDKCFINSDILDRCFYKAEIIRQEMKGYVLSIVLENLNDKYSINNDVY